jgi:hypothetical protein
MLFSRMYHSVSSVSRIVVPASADASSAAFVSKVCGSWIGGRGWPCAWRQSIPRRATIAFSTLPLITTLRKYPNGESYFSHLASYTMSSSDKLRTRENDLIPGATVASLPTVISSPAVFAHFIVCRFWSAQAHFTPEDGRIIQHRGCLFPSAHPSRL